jgi:Zinc-binding domain of primase-helicase
VAGAEVFIHLHACMFWTARGLPGSRALPGRIVENHPCLDAFRLEEGCHRARRTAGNLELADGQLIPIRSHPICRTLMFVCPRCGADRYRLYEVDGKWACRKCQGLIGLAGTVIDPSPG